MDQLTLAQSSFEPHRKTTRREQFLLEMDQIVPWSQLCRLISPYYPKPGNGRPPLELERMLRIYFMQQWFNLSDPGAEEALYDSHAMQRFIGLDLGKESAPDETTICKFRHLLERHDLGKKLFASVGKHLQDKGIKIANGTIVDATIINAPPSTKNEDKARDPDMHQTRKGNQWYFGMKTHIGVDSKSKVIHSVVVTAANVHDSQVFGDLLHGEETRVWGDSAYTGQGDVLAEKAPDALDFTHDRAKRNQPLTDEQIASNRFKSKVRAKVEHAFGVMKNIFGFRKVRYRGLDKNANAVFVLSALTNLFMMRRRLLQG